MSCIMNFFSFFSKIYKHNSIFSCWLKIIIMSYFFHTVFESTAKEPRCVEWQVSTQQSASGFLPPRSGNGFPCHYLSVTDSLGKLLSPFVTNQSPLLSLSTRPRCFCFMLICLISFLPSLLSFFPLTSFCPPTGSS
jgi:hypothetical protein